MEPELVNGYQHNQYDDPSANLWTTYLSKSEKDDKVMAQNWKGDMDAILIFAGLFSASLTAFIIESYKTLNPDPNNASVILLSQILQRLSATSNTSVGAFPLNINNFNDFRQGNFSPSTSSLICNVLWFLSLGFSLICALSATLVEQWTRQYLQASTSKPAPQDRARMGAYLHEGIKKYKMTTIVETIPMLLHISLFLFFGGLVAFLVPLNTGLEYLILAILVCFCTLYILVTLLPVFELCCPYWTPLSRHFWTLFQSLQLLHRRDADGNKIPVLRHMSEAREIEAMEITPARDERDFKAICWTINAQREDHEFEPFVEAIPKVVSGFDYSAKWLLYTLLNHHDINIKLGYRIPRLLETCNSGLLDSRAAHRRAITCLKSIWSLTMLSLPTTTPLLRESLRFKEDTLGLVYTVQKIIPAVANYALSTSTAIARNLLDMHLARMIAFEEHLLNILRTGRSAIHTDSDTIHMTSSERSKIVEDALGRIHKVQVRISEARNFTVPTVYATLDALASHYNRIESLTYNMESGSDEQILYRVVDSVRCFLAILNQAGVHLTLEYISTILGSETLPHEASNTLRRAYLRITFGRLSNNITLEGQTFLDHFSSRKIILPKDSQRSLLAYLEAALEITISQSTRFPQTIIDIILNLSQALTDTTLIAKAIRTIKNYSTMFPNDSASRALHILGQALPQDPLPLDLFSSHIYVDAKPDLQSSRTTTRSNTLTSIQTLDLSEVAS